MFVWVLERVLNIPSLNISLLIRHRLPIRTFCSGLSGVFVPQGWHKALEISYWKAAMVEEIGAFSKNDTWKLVFLPTGKKTVGSSGSTQSNKRFLAQ